MTAPRAVLTTAGVLLLAACAAGVPSQPSLLALPGTGRSLDQFNADDAQCRHYAAQRVPAPAGDDWVEAQRSYDFAYIQCMYVKGHKVPVPGQLVGPPPAGPPPQNKDVPRPE